MSWGSMISIFSKVASLYLSYVSKCALTVICVWNDKWLLSSGQAVILTLIYALWLLSVALITGWSEEGTYIVGLAVMT